MDAAAGDTAQHNRQRKLPDGHNLYSYRQKARETAIALSRAFFCCFPMVFV